MTFSNRITRLVSSLAYVNTREESRVVDHGKEVVQSLSIQEERQVRIATQIHGVLQLLSGKIRSMSHAHVSHVSEHGEVITGQRHGDEKRDKAVP